MKLTSANINVMVLACRKASKILIRDFGELESLQVSAKGPKDFVTNADKKVEKILINELSKAKNKFSILSEEIGLIENSDKNNIWVIDPIDGTTNFANGLPNFSISIGLLKNSEPIAGAIWVPWPNKNNCLIFSTAKNEGSWIDNAKISINKSQFSLGGGAISSYSSFSPIFGNIDRKINPMNKRLRGDKRVIGSVAYEMAMITKGSIGFSLLGPAFIWDFGAGLLLIKEAGGVVMELNNNYEPISEFESFVKNYHQDKESYMKLKNWNGKFIAGHSNIMKLDNHEKFV